VIIGFGIYWYLFIAIYTHWYFRLKLILNVAVLSSVVMHTAV